MPGGVNKQETANSRIFTDADPKHGDMAQHLHRVKLTRKINRYVLPCAIADQ